MYGPDLPTGVLPIAEAFTAVYKTGAAVLLAPFRFFFGSEVQSGGGIPRPPDTKTLPPPDRKEIGSS
jgi:hypothetical protein